MIDATGVITIDGKPMGQIQIVKSRDGNKRVQLYNTAGVFLCDCGFDGDDDLGFMVGQGLFNGYMTGQNNTTIAIGAAVNRVLYARTDMTL